MDTTKMILPDKTIHKNTSRLKVGQLAYVDPAIVSPMPGQPREYFDPAEMESLRRSILAIGQQEAVKVIMKGANKLRLRDGERRWRNCTAIKFPLLVQVVEALSDEEEFVRAIIANLHKSEHTAIEKARAMKRLQDTGKTYEEISVIFGCTTATVNNHLQLFRDLDPRVLNFMDPKSTGKERILQHTVALELTPFKNDIDHQFALALRIVGERLSLSKARALIQREARRLNITEGRGLNTKPVDQRRNLYRALESLGVRMDSFLDMGSREIQRIFQTIPAMEYDNMKGMAKRRIVELKKLLDILETIKNPGCKKSSSM